MAHIDKKIECLGTSFLCNELYEVSVCLQMFLSFCDLNTLQVCDEKEKERLARLKELSDIDIK